MPINAKRLARLLAEEFESENWGDIDPDLFRHIADHLDKEEIYEQDEEARELLSVLERIAARIA